MVVGLVILAFLVGAFLGSLGMALACAKRKSDDEFRRLYAERQARRANAVRVLRHANSY
jgi:hypothetical protein